MFRQDLTWGGLSWLSAYSEIGISDAPGRVQKGTIVIYNHSFLLKRVNPASLNKGPLCSEASYWSGRAESPGSQLGGEGGVGDPTAHTDRRPLEHHGGQSHEGGQVEDEGLAVEGCGLG